MINSIVLYICTTIIGMLIGYLMKTISSFSEIKSAIRGLLRVVMVDVYYHYRDSRKIPYYVKEAWLLNYDIYKKLNGNSFIDTLKDEIEKWEVI